MGIERITDGDSVLERVSFIRFLPIIVLLVTVGLAAGFYISFPQWPVWLRVAGSLAIVLFLMYPLRTEGLLKNGVARLLGGEAKIQIDAGGIVLARRMLSQHYHWEEVRSIEANLDVEANMSYREFTIDLQDGRRITVHNDEQWQKLQAVLAWSGLSEQDIKIEHYDAASDRTVALDALR